MDSFKRRLPSLPTIAFTSHVGGVPKLPFVDQPIPGAALALVIFNLPVGLDSESALQPPALMMSCRASAWMNVGATLAGYLLIVLVHAESSPVSSQVPLKNSQHEAKVRFPGLISILVRTSEYQCNTFH
ncbi:unnamed protein product [Cyclocybe aegerita]|uniref:Uncharacterized protein n=1 Tax=Cyclocybe aegerita TaxID=1973307 RepID=A0A8S0XPH2_CYCAE|nr:unnamed protein product [Cyclocybe aegerita]